jgi:hypothetical protein
MTITDRYKDPLADAVALAAPLVVAEGRRLLLQYEIANDLSEPIYLANRLFVWSWQGLSLDPNLVYTEVLGTRLRLTKAFIPVPRGADVEEAEPPYLSEVAAGAVFADVLELPLPLEPFHPHDAIAPRDEVYTFDQVELAVGWLMGSAVDVQLVQGQADEILIAADPEQLRHEQKLLLTTLSVSVPAYFGPSEGALS